MTLLQFLLIYLPGVGPVTGVQDPAIEDIVTKKEVARTGVEVKTENGKVSAVEAGKGQARVVEVEVRNDLRENEVEVGNVAIGAVEARVKNGKEEARAVNGSEVVAKREVCSLLTAAKCRG